MSAIKKLMEGQNDFVNPVSTALLEYGAGSPMNDEEAAKKEAACMIAGILIAVKVSIMQACSLIQDMELDEIGE